MTKPFIIPLDLTAGTVSAGVHRARCTEAKYEANKMRDGNNLVLEFEIMTPGEEGRKLKMWQSMKPSVAWRYTKVFDSFGDYERDTKGNAVFASEGAFIKHFVNRTVKLQVSHSDYQGEARAQIDNVLPDGDGVTAPPVGLPTGIGSLKPAQMASLPKRVAPKAEEVEELPEAKEESPADTEDISKELDDQLSDKSEAETLAVKAAAKTTTLQPLKTSKAVKGKLETTDVELDPASIPESDLPF